VGLAADVRSVKRSRWTRPIVDEFLGPDDAAELAELLADRTVFAPKIWRALQDRGIGVSESAVVKWAAEARRHQ
jgi:hypothetical protein